MCLCIVVVSHSARQYIHFVTILVFERNFSGPLEGKDTESSEEIIFDRRKILIVIGVTTAALLVSAIFLTIKLTSSHATPDSGKGL